MPTLQGQSSVLEVLERVLEKGIVIDAEVRVSLVGIDLATVDARVIVASLETYLKYTGILDDSGSRVALSDRARADRAEQEFRSVDIVRRAFDALNGHDVEGYAALLDDSYIGETHGVRRPVRGRKASRHAVDMYFRLLPDCHFTIEGAIATEHDVLVSWLATGTPRDQYSGASLTAEPLRVPGCTLTRLKHGKIVHAWNYWDLPTSTG
jgi:gas vesicle structural protein